MLICLGKIFQINIIFAPFLKDTPIIVSAWRPANSMEGLESKLFTQQRAGPSGWGCRRDPPPKEALHSPCWPTSQSELGYPVPLSKGATDFRVLAFYRFSWQFTPSCKDRLLWKEPKLPPHHIFKGNWPPAPEFNSKFWQRERVEKKRIFNVTLPKLLAPRWLTLTGKVHPGGRLGGFFPWETQDISMALLNWPWKSCPFSFS